MKAFRKLLFASLPSLLLLSCTQAGEAGSDCENGQCEAVALEAGEVDVTDNVCDRLLRNAAGRSSVSMADLNDPFINLVYKRIGDADGQRLNDEPPAEVADLFGPGEWLCPVTYPQVMAKLRVRDTQNCSGDPRSGISTRVITEEGQLTGEVPGHFRTVTTRRCNGRQSHELLFSQFSFPGSPANDAAEVMAFDTVDNVFNYYDLRGGRVDFFGDSNELLTQGAGGGDTRKCAKCHTTGGLVMKELDTPWVHWEGHMNIPGASDLVDGDENFGRKATGAEFEGLTKNGNREWNKERLQTLKETNNLRKVLEPLFCTPQINLDNGADFESSKISRIPSDAMLDPQLSTSASISISFDDYKTQIAKNGQNIPGHPDKDDTVFDFTFVERSHVDMDYVSKLQSEGIVDNEFVRDVLSVDFTRPIFSEDRCGLLAHAPNLSAAEMTAERVRAGFKSSLENAGRALTGAENELLINLTNEGGHREPVDAFVKACRDLSGEPGQGENFLENALIVASLNRKIAQALPVVEERTVFPSDTLSIAPGTRLDPETCTIRTDFKGVAKLPEPEPEPGTVLPYETRFEPGQPGFENVGRGGLSTDFPAGTEIAGATKTARTNSLSKSYKSRKLQTTNCIALGDATRIQGSFRAAASTANGGNDLRARVRFFWFSDAECTQEAADSTRGDSVQLTEGSYETISFADGTRGATHVKMRIELRDSNRGSNTGDDFALDDVRIEKVQ